MTWQWWSVAPVWVLALAGGGAVGVLAGPSFLTWIPVVLGVIVLVTAVIQLSIQRKDGLVTRMVLSLGGALVVLAATTGVLLAVHPGVTVLPTLD